MTEGNPKEITTALDSIRQYLTNIVDLKQGVNKGETVTEIRDKMTISGANAWMLMCSIVIASIGLNLDSQAVIIGAMLISPLMSPILGIGTGVGINDLPMLRRALIHFGISIIIAVVTSTIYFYLSPFIEMGPEIEARTKPTFLDVIIAFFGGVAGIVSIARKDISTTMPGVAIATALMPPLCVTGYGIANGHWNIALSSFYLFFLNTFFVSLATYLIVRYLKFPYKQYLSIANRRKGRWMIILFSIIVIIPSLLIFQKVFKEYRTKAQVDKFVKEYLSEDRIYLDDYIFMQNESPQKLVLKVYGDQINEDRIPELKRGLARVGLENTEIDIISTSEIDLNQLTKLQDEVSGLKGIEEKLEIAQAERQEDNDEILSLQEKILIQCFDSSSISSITEEYKSLFPNLNSFHLGKMNFSNFNNSTQNLPVLITDWNRNVTPLDKIKIHDFTKARLKLDTLILINQ